MVSLPLLDNSVLTALCLLGRLVWCVERPRFLLGSTGECGLVRVKRTVADREAELMVVAGRQHD